eukprot:Nk52_evm15s245 gene=Nk52_evmTU15s245
MFTSLKEKFKNAAENSLNTLEDAMKPSPEAQTGNEGKSPKKGAHKGHKYPSDQEFFDHATRAEHIEQMIFQSKIIQKFEGRLRDVVAAYRSVVKEKDSLEASLRALTLSPSKSNMPSETKERKVIESQELEDSERIKESANANCEANEEGNSNAVQKKCAEEGDADDVDNHNIQCAGVNSEEKKTDQREEAVSVEDRDSGKSNEAVASGEQQSNEELFPYASGHELSKEVEAQSQFAMQEMRDQHDGVVKDLERKLEVLTESLKVLNDEKASSVKKFKEDRKMLIERCREQVSQARDEVTKKDETLEAMQETISALEKKLQVTTEKLATANKEKGAQNDELHSQIKGLKVTLQRQQNSHKSEMDNQTSMIKELNKMVGKERQNIVSLQNQMVKMQKGSEEKVDDTKKLHSDYKLKISNLNARISDLENSLGVCTSSLSDMEAEKRSLEGRLKDMKIVEEKARTLEMKIQDMVGGHAVRSESDRNLIHSLEKKIETYQIQERQREQQCLELESQANEISLLLGKYERQRVEDNSKIAKLREENTLLEEMFAGRHFTEKAGGPSRTMLSLEGDEEKRTSDDGVALSVGTGNSALGEISARADELEKVLETERKKFEDEKSNLLREIEALAKENSKLEKERKSLGLVEERASLLEDKLSLERALVSDLEAKLERERDAKLTYLEDLRHNRETAQELIDEKELSMTRVKQLLRAYQEKYPYDDLTEGSAIHTTQSSVSSSCSDVSGRKTSINIGVSSETEGGGNGVFEQIVNRSQISAKTAELVYFSRIEASWNTEKSRLKDKVFELERCMQENDDEQSRTEELIATLKEEIRKLERDKKRRDHGINMEYLKNVMMQFLRADTAGMERLLPVISTMLQFSPQETETIKEKIKSRGGGTSAGSQLMKWSKSFRQ